MEENLGLYLLGIQDQARPAVWVLLKKYIMPRASNLNGIDNMTLLNYQTSDSALLLLTAPSHLIKYGKLFLFF